MNSLRRCKSWIDSGESDMDLHQVRVLGVAVQLGRTADIDAKQRGQLLDHIRVQLQRLALIQPAEAVLSRPPARLLDVLDSS